MNSREENRQIRKEFWEAFSNYTRFFSLKIGKPVAWMLYKTGIKGLELKFDFENGAVQVLIEINLKNEERRFDIFAELDYYKKILESGFEQELVWLYRYVLPGNKIVSRIYTELKGLKFQKDDNWPEIFKFMAENMYQLQSNFIEILPLIEDKYGKGTDSLF